MVVPLFPYDFCTNLCYRFMQDEYAKSKTVMYRESFLVENFGFLAINALTDVGYLSELNNEYVKLSFEEEGTAPYLVLDYVREEVHLFLEILKNLPAKTHYTKQKLKHCLSFLANFKQIQYFPLQCSSILAVAADTIRIDHHVDVIYKKPEEFMEPEYLYRIDVDENVAGIGDLNPFLF